MRILHVNKFLYRRGGVESYMFDCVALQRAAGHEVALFGMDHPANDPHPFAGHFPSYVEFAKRDLSLVSKTRLAARALRSQSAQSGIARTIRDFQPDVAHVHLIYHQLSPSVLRPLADAGVPIVMTLHDYSLVCPTYLLLDHNRPCEACLGSGVHHAIRRRCKDGAVLPSAFSAFEVAVHRLMRAYDPVDLFLCPSKFLQERIQTHPRYASRLRHLPLFVDAAAIEPARRPDRRVLFAGRLSPEKGADVLIRAAAALPADVDVTIAGEGPAAGELRALADTVAPGRVRFAGRLDEPDIRQLIATSAVVAIPSRAYENQPMVALEALAAAVPVVGSGHGALAELITPGEDGELVAPDDPKALADALRSLLADPARAATMGAAGRRKVRRLFDPSGHLIALERIYLEARTRHDRGLAGVGGG